MKYGYVFTYDEKKIFSEISFCKKHFDFLELTLKLEGLDSLNSRAKTFLKSFNIVGHLDWSINLSEYNGREISKAIKLISLFKEIGTEKVTIHPSYNEVLDVKEIIENDIKSLNKISNFCKRKGLQLMLENTTYNPFNKSSVIKEILNEVPYLTLTLDIGHVLKTSRVELKDFLKLGEKINHIHIHDVFNSIDHLFFSHKLKLKKIIKKVKNIGYDGTISFECFSVVRSKKIINLEDDERRNELLNHLFVVKREIK
jgi:sugar phosphate isomerase/epimerase